MKNRKKAISPLISFLSTLNSLIRLSLNIKMENIVMRILTIWYFVLKNKMLL